MSKFYTNNYSDINLYRKKSSKSEVMTQMIYGDNFSAIKKSNKWWKIKIKEDGYIGFVKKKNFIKSVKPTHKVSKLSAKIYKKPNFKKPSGKLTFGTKIKFEEKKSRFIKFQNNWIEAKNLKPMKFKNKNVFLFTGKVKENSGNFSFFDKEFVSIINSFSNLKEAEKSLALPLKIKLHKVKRGESYNSLSLQSPIPFDPETKLRLLNGDYPDDPLRVGRVIKIVK